MNTPTEEAINNVVCHSMFVAGFVQGSNENLTEDNLNALSAHCDNLSEACDQLTESLDGNQ